MRLPFCLSLKGKIMGMLLTGRHSKKGQKGVPLISKKSFRIILIRMRLVDKLPCLLSTEHYKNSMESPYSVWFLMLTYYN